jgi:uncharacterized protein with HEPN domain
VFPLVGGYSLEQYLADEKTRAAIERVLEIFGEAMNGLYKVALAIARKIPHVIGSRNILCKAMQSSITTRFMTSRSSMRPSS